MKKFEFTISRTSYGIQHFEVEAENIEDAEILAMEEAYNTVFHSHDTYYEVEHKEETQ